MKWTYINPYREQYERDLRERQAQHLESIGGSSGQNWRPCMHDACERCHGTGVSAQGACVHMISCPCPRCTPWC